MNIDQQWHELSRTISFDLRENGRIPRQYAKGDKVRRDSDGKVYTVQRSYWQNYAGGETSDFTVELESIDANQPTPWDKSRNLKPVGKHPCPRCDAANEIVNQCGCDPNNMPTRRE